MCQSLATIGPETFEIRRAKKSKRIETSAVKYNGRRPASWRAAKTDDMHLCSSEILTASMIRHSNEKEQRSIKKLCDTITIIHKAAKQVAHLTSNLLTRFDHRLTWQIKTEVRLTISYNLYVTCLRHLRQKLLTQSHGLN